MNNQTISIDAGNYQHLHQLAFASDYVGYKPNIIESPNGDGNLDVDKRYSHIATKYLREYHDIDPSASASMAYFNMTCYLMAKRVAEALNIPEEFHPVYEYGAVRVLDYPVGAITHPHTDFDLFTLMMYRDQPDKFKILDNEPADDIKAINEQVHYGELLEMIKPELKATAHEVVASDTPQHSIVYFAIPDHKAVLPNGQTVLEWLTERMNRSRYSKED